MKSESYRPWSNDMPPEVENSPFAVKGGPGIVYNPELRVTQTFDKDGNPQIVVLAQARIRPKYLGSAYKDLLIQQRDFETFTEADRLD